MMLAVCRDKSVKVPLEAGYWQKKEQPGHGNRDPGFAEQLLGILQDFVFYRRHVSEAHGVIVLLCVLVEEPGPDAEWLDVPANPTLHQISSTETMGEQRSSPATEILNQDPVFWAGIAIHLGGIYQGRVVKSRVTSIVGKRRSVHAVEVGVLPSLGMAGQY